MLDDQELACLMIAAGVCAQDGLISQAEEEVLFKEFKKRYPILQLEEFDSYLDSFFESNRMIEDYLIKVKDKKLRTFVIKASKKSASADGLDIRENIALQKVIKYWGDLG